jgi:hypothetical protein
VVLKNFNFYYSVFYTGITGVPDFIQPPKLPDGTFSVEIKPDFLLPFGDIPPCDPNKPGEPSCISREVVLRTRGAMEGTLSVAGIYCFEASFTQQGIGRFDLNLVKS